MDTINETTQQTTQQTAHVQKRPKLKRQTPVADDGTGGTSDNTIQKDSKNDSQKDSKNDSQKDSKNDESANTKILFLKKSIGKIEAEIKVVADSILKDDNDSPESSWRLMRLSLEETLNEKKKTLKEIEENNIDSFMKRAISNRQNRSSTNNPHSFGIAKADAEARVFQIVALPADEIAYCFSTNTLQIVPAWGNIRPHKFMHMWYHDLRKKENNVIPLSYGIEAPRKKDPNTGEFKEINFMVSFFYNDPAFIEKCCEYYRRFGITFVINKDKKINNKFYLKLLVENELIFNF